MIVALTADIHAGKKAFGLSVPKWLESFGDLVLQGQRYES